MKKQTNHTYREFTDVLRESGWTCEGPVQWRHTSGEVVSPESIEDLCTHWPAFTGHALKLLSEGLSVRITTATDGVVMTALVEPISAC